MRVLMVVVLGSVAGCAPVVDSPEDAGPEESCTASFYDDEGDARFTTHDDAWIFRSRSNTPGCDNPDDAYLVTVTIEGDYGWRSGNPADDQVSIAFGGGLTPRGCDGSPIATRVDATECRAPDACMIFCGFCSAAPSKDMAVQVSDDFGRSNAVCVSDEKPDRP